MPAITHNNIYEALSGVFRVMVDTGALSILDIAQGERSFDAEGGILFDPHAWQRRLPPNIPHPYSEHLEGGEHAEFERPGM